MGGREGGARGLGGMSGGLGGGGDGGTDGGRLIKHIVNSVSIALKQLVAKLGAMESRSESIVIGA